MMPAGIFYAGNYNVQAGARLVLQHNDAVIWLVGMQ